MRRLIAIAAIAASISYWPAVKAGDEPDEDFICLTKGHPPLGDFDVVPHAAGSNDWKVFNYAVEKLGMRPFGAFSVSNRWLPSDGLTKGTGVITLGIHFLGGTENQRADVRKTAVEWLEGDLGKTIAFKFDVPKAESQIRIGFLTTGPDSGAWSEIGRKAEGKGQTMNLQPVNRRKILHEFGHALGLHHEHRHPDSGIKWIESAIIADLVPPWDEADVRSQITKVLPKNTVCAGDPEFNPESIMIYPIKKRWNENGFSTPTYQTISDRDRKCLEGVYAKPNG